MEPVSIVVGVIGSVITLLGAKALHMTIKSDCMGGSVEVNVETPTPNISIPVESRKSALAVEIPRVLEGEMPFEVDKVLKAILEKINEEKKNDD